MNYITIPDFAKKVGMSKQAIYNRLDKDLNKYTKIENGRKYIDESATILFTSSITTNYDTEQQQIEELKTLIDELNTKINELVINTTKALINNQEIFKTVLENQSNERVNKVKCIDYNSEKTAKTPQPIRSKRVNKILDFFRRGQEKT